MRRFEVRPLAALVETASRGGYLARGVVHVSVGVVALLAALDLTPWAEGVLGALEAWRQWPAGLALLWLTGLGLYAFAGWRALQALFDVDGKGRSPRALLSRLGQAISGAAYAAMAISIFGLLDAIEDLGESDDQAKTRALVARALELPMGDLMVTGAGLFIAGCGIGSIVRAAVDHFGRGLDCDARIQRWAGALARAGYLGRGVALTPAGLFLVVAGWRARAGEARGLGGALNALEAQPLGAGILGVTALGLIAFGLFAVVEGWLRPMRPERAVDA
jgi:hypothetical protein